jgi:hypothetical protein
MAPVLESEEAQYSDRVQECLTLHPLLQANSFDGMATPVLDSEEAQYSDRVQERRAQHAEHLTTGTARTE